LREHKFTYLLTYLLTGNGVGPSDDTLVEKLASQATGMDTVYAGRGEQRLTMINHYL